MCISVSVDVPGSLLTSHGHRKQAERDSLLLHGASYRAGSVAPDWRPAAHLKEVSRQLWHDRVTNLAPSRN